MAWCVTPVSCALRLSNHARHAVLHNKTVADESKRYCSTETLASSDHEKLCAANAVNGPCICSLASQSSSARYLFSRENCRLFVWEHQWHILNVRHKCSLRGHSDQILTRIEAWAGSIWKTRDGSQEGEKMKSHAERPRVHYASFSRCASAFSRDCGPLTFLL